MVLKYRKFTGSIEYSEADNIWYGYVLTYNGKKIKDLVNYHSYSKDKLFHEFKISIIEYTRFCHELGKKIG